MRQKGFGKKVFSLVLAAAMTASLCTPAWAEELNVVEPAGQVATAENALPSTDGSASMLIESEDSSVPTTTAPAAGDAVNVSNFDELTQAVTTAPDGQERVILLDQDLVLKNSLDVKAGQIIVLDLQGHNVTASPDFPAGRMFVNNGTLTLRGNGTVDMSAAGANGYGAVNNYGTLVVVDGTYRNTKESGASVFYNRKGGKATFENPAIISGCGAVATEKDVTTTINGGRYSSETYPAVENRGNMLITGGEFANTSCSACTSNWGYTVRSGESSDTAYLKIQGAAEDSVRVTGVQGGLAVIGGTADVYNGVYQTVSCSVHSSGASAFYAGYFTGESYKTSTNIYGGTFSSCSKTGILVGNGNPAPDSGNGESSTVMIYGGSFTGGDAAKTALSVNEQKYAVVAARISGGTFSSDAGKFVPTYCKTENDSLYTVTPVTQEEAVAQNGSRFYLSLQDAIADVGQDETITMLRDVSEAEGMSVASGKDFTVDFAGHTYTVSRPGAGSPNTETNAFQLLKDSTITFKNGTLRISEKNLQAGAGNPIMRLIQNYADLTLEDMQIYAANQSGGEDYVLSINNGNVVFKGNTSIYMSDPNAAIAFDVYKFSSYPSASVTFDENYTGVIEGTIVYDSNDNTRTLTVRGNGHFVGITKTAGSAAQPVIQVERGYFVQAPTPYLAANKMAVTSDLDGYHYMVVDKGTTAAEVVPGEPALSNPAAGDAAATKEEKELAVYIGNELENLKVENDVLNAEANTVANANTSTEDEGKMALVNEKIVVDPADTVTIVIQPYLDIELQKTEIEGEKKSFQLDITPMYRKIATTNSDNIQMDTNAVEMGKPAKLNVTKPVEMTIQLPSDFAAEGTTLYVLHQKGDGRRYQYEGTVDDTGVLTFTNPNGFSVFTVSTQEFDLSTNDTTDSSNTTTTPAATPAPTAAPQQSGSNITYYTCQACGYHDWTATAEGYKCNHCGYIESVKQLSGYGNVKGVYEPKTSTAAAQTGAAASGTVSSAIPQTGDEQPIAALVVVAVAALLGLGVTVVMKKRNNG